MKITELIKQLQHALVITGDFDSTIEIYMERRDEEASIDEVYVSKDAHSKKPFVLLKATPYDGD